ncbi:Retrovirus-related Pol polyprotein from transposon TNT 1-94 [Cucumis melo var. makuwa]|uniref:Retrovirus-related Pol polyprotein from transposon TNT 1-94 n=1 Tax=Cucumis melo var. makuwa TaxID=1194695 RepID=A0A5D3BSZ0_CUCMM|nr:Retrovirus-related Pol polyprotein from transposon TNT 1-94 [Cucumis melo var. makuwa]TYK02264.1 Retrovirus-related Pol polyprotein from transposon TNT 1-94 [Cucumis melo var. makuwa]
MRMFEDKLEDIIIIEKILRSLTPKFNFVVYAIEETKNIDDLSLDELQSSLLVHEQKLKQQNKEEQALKASIETPSSEVEAEVKRREATTNGISSNISHDTVNLKEKEEDGDEEAITQKVINGSREESTNFAEQEEEVSLLMVCHLNEETQPNLWYLDTGCSTYMCGDKGVFSEPNETFCNTVKFGNSTVSVMGKGKITLQIKGDIIHTISNVLFVLDLKTTLLSVGEHDIEPDVFALSPKPYSFMFFSKAINLSIHLLNRSSTFPVQNQTPEEAWSGQKPNIDNFRIFGCIAYAHVPDAKRSKLDDKGEKCIFHGVCEQSKTYKLYNLITKKIVISRDVVFNEAEFWSHEECKPDQRIQIDFENGDEGTRQ